MGRPFSLKTKGIHMIFLQIKGFLRRAAINNAAKNRIKPDAWQFARFSMHSGENDLRFIAHKKDSSQVSTMV